MDKKNEKCAWCQRPTPFGELRELDGKRYCETCHGVEARIRRIRSEGKSGGFGLPRATK